MRLINLRRSRRSRGVALVEFALVAPLLFLLIFGIIEFGWAYIQYLDVRHGAREGGRLAAVAFGPGGGNTQANAIIDETCSRLDNDSGVSITLSAPNGAAVGQSATVTVVKSYESLTGFFSVFDPTLDSTVEIRLEQAASWSTGAAYTRACP
jgi:Flp pilus assembly protein TadG